MSNDHGVAVYTGAGMAAYRFTPGSLPDGRGSGSARLALFVHGPAAGELAGAPKSGAPPASDEQPELSRTPAYLEPLRRRCAGDRRGFDICPTPAHVPAAAACADPGGLLCSPAPRACVTRDRVALAGRHVLVGGGPPEGLADLLP